MMAASMVEWRVAMKVVSQVPWMDVMKVAWMADEMAGRMVVP